MGLKRNSSENSIFFKRICQLTTMKVATIVIFLVSLVGLNNGYANAQKDNQLHKIYHIYIKNQYIGAVSNEKLIDQHIEDKVKKLAHNTMIYLLIRQIYPLYQSKFSKRIQMMKIL